MIAIWHYVTIDLHACKSKPPSQWRRVLARVQVGQAPPGWDLNTDRRAGLTGPSPFLGFEKRARSP